MIVYKDLHPIRLMSEIPLEARMWRNDERIRRWCREFTLITPHDQNDWLNYISSTSKVEMFGVGDGVQHVGVAGLTSIDYVNKSAEFSLYIAPQYQKKGYGKKALLTLLRHGFNDFNLHRIWGETFEGNPAYKMFMDIDMKHEGTLKEAYFLEGRYVDCHRIAILRDDFKQPKLRLT